ncbi:hypothetical protein JOE21_000076 [Desmospora profundinema]|uniref:Uncharacterized protein n=1 Tax=Desmospora profundinema TaxID=1571184 RepID=A0ABU1II67_9BACL|nr:hypothetical protein [Desmospora profundinema]
MVFGSPLHSQKQVSPGSLTLPGFAMHFQRNEGSHTDPGPEEPRQYRINIVL